MTTRVNSGLTWCKQRLAAAVLGDGPLLRLRVAQRHCPTVDPAMSKAPRHPRPQRVRIAPGTVRQTAVNGEMLELILPTERIVKTN